MKQIVYDEVYTVLSMLGDDYVSKVPHEFLDFIATNRSGEYIKLDNRPLQEQGLDRETTLILAALKLDYWCENDAEKQILLDLLETNDGKLKGELMNCTSTRELMKLLKRR